MYLNAEGIVHRRFSIVGFPTYNYKYNSYKEMVKLKKTILLGFAFLLAACTANTSPTEIETITDENTKPEIELVEATKNTILVEWGSDAMDRGNHDYFTSAHSELVVDPGLFGGKSWRGDLLQNT